MLWRDQPLWQTTTPPNWAECLHTQFLLPFYTLSPCLLQGSCWKGSWSAGSWVIEGLEQTRPSDSFACKLNKETQGKFVSVLCVWFNFVEQGLGQRFWALCLLVMSAETQSKPIRRESQRVGAVHRGAEGARRGISWLWELKRGAPVPFAFLVPIPPMW